MRIPGVNWPAHGFCPCWRRNHSSEYALLDDEDHQSGQSSENTCMGGRERTVLRLVAAALSFSASLSIRILNFHPVLNATASTLAGFLPAAMLTHDRGHVELAKIRKAVFPFLICLSIVFSDVWATYGDKPNVQEASLGILLAMSGVISQQLLWYVWKKGAIQISPHGKTTDSLPMTQPISNIRKLAPFVFHALSSMAFGFMTRLYPTSIFSPVFEVFYMYSTWNFTSRVVTVGLNRKIEQAQGESSVYQTIKTVFLSASYCLSFLGYALLPFPGISRKASQQTQSLQRHLMGATLGAGKGFETESTEEMLAKTSRNRLEALQTVKLHNSMRIASWIAMYATVVGVWAWQMSTLNSLNPKIVYSGFLGGGLTSLCMRMVTERKWDSLQSQPLIDKGMKFLVFSPDILGNDLRDLYTMFVSVIPMDSEFLDTIENRWNLAPFWLVWFAFSYRAFYEAGANISNHFGNPHRDISQTFFNSVKTFLWTAFPRKA